jgi:RNA polymerase sigma factor (sigma-70 family)
MDENCIHRILNGDPEAFRQLIAKYKDMAYSIAMSVVKDEFYAEEIIQGSFLIAYNKLATFKGASKFSTWFYKIVINESFKLAKKHKAEFVDFMDAPPEISDEIDNAILKLEVDDQKYFINEALKKLSAKESLVLRLFYLDEDSIEEIAGITGWSSSNIKVVLHRARINLRYVLSEIYKFDKKVLY